LGGGEGRSAANQGNDCIGAKGRDLGQRLIAVAYMYAVDRCWLIHDT
jgi:hypothetical protein